MLGYDGHKVEGISVGQPPFLSVVSLELARRILNNEYQRKDITIPFPSVTSETVKVGETVFPKLPDSFFDDFTDAGANAIVTLCPQGQPILVTLATLSIFQGLAIRMLPQPGGQVPDAYTAVLANPLAPWSILYMIALGAGWFLFRRTRAG
jgi:hypothetical protein